MILRWLLAVVLSAITLWFLYLTAFNGWAAGGPPNTAQDKEIYLHRFYVFLSLSGVAFVPFVFLCVKNIRLMKKSKI